YPRPVPAPLASREGGSRREERQGNVRDPGRPVNDDAAALVPEAGHAAVPRTSRGYRGGPDSTVARPVPRRGDADLGRAGVAEGRPGSGARPRTDGPTDQDPGADVLGVGLVALAEAGAMVEGEE